ncbi:MAG TPA: DNA primase [Nocardioides bacterium]|nr:DNA primase [Nocardioides sp.]
MFYPGKLHTVSSESEGGKTWLMLSVVRDELDAGNQVVYVDFEDDEGGVVGRLLTLGATAADVAARFHYIRPEDALGTGVHLHDLTELMREARPTLGVIDGVTEALTLHGLSPNDNSDVAKFGRMLPRRISAAGAASVSLDHVTKSNETRGRYSLGAVHKLNGLDGAAYVLENRSPFGVGLTGKSTLRIAKDRPGQLRKHALPHTSGLHWMGDLVLVSHPEGFAEVDVAAPETRDQDFRPTIFMTKIMALIEERGPSSKRIIRAGVRGKATTIDAALDRLILDGYLTESTPHTKLKGWPELSDEGGEA